MVPSMGRTKKRGTQESEIQKYQRMLHYIHFVLMLALSVKDVRTRILSGVKKGRGKVAPPGSSVWPLD